MENNQKGNTSVSEGREPDFVWQDYLDDTESVGAPPTAFSHVEFSLESAFKAGMKLEVPNPDEPDAYWLVSVIMTCGDLLTLRYAGYGDDRSADFWFNVKSGEFHPMGWCTANNKKLWPPKSLLKKYPDVDTRLVDELRHPESIPSNLSENTSAGFMPFEQIKCGMKLEIKDEFNPKNIWIATIMQNVGGRLLLEYDVPAQVSSKDVWLFYLSDRLFPIGYAKEKGYLYSPPAGIKENAPAEQWDLVLSKSLKDAEKSPFPAHLFEPKMPLIKHEFEVGMKLEAVNTQNYSELCPATIVEVVDFYYIGISIDSFGDSEESKQVFYCHSNFPFIFPIKWAEENGLELTVPKGYTTPQFSWDEYLQFCSAAAAPKEYFPMMHMNIGFENGMKLEAADPVCPSNIHAATIRKVVEPLMMIHFDSEESEEQFIFSSISSLDIFPVGWCVSNFYPLKTPSAFKAKVKMGLIPIKEELPERQETPAVTLNVQQEYISRLWCPKIYFNHRCFTGPLLSKGRLAELPQAIGPGPLQLVITEVIYRVVNIAYNSSRVLQILQIDGEPTPGMEQQVIKAKYKGKSYRATIEVITSSEEVEEFCKNICQKLQCCPYLFSPKHVGESCPINCHTQTKTKFGYHFAKKKKLGRPPLNRPQGPPPDPSEVVKRGPGRKRKKHRAPSAKKKAAEEEEKRAEELTVSADNSELVSSVSEPMDASTSESKDTPKCDTDSSNTQNVPKSDSAKDKSEPVGSKAPLVGKKKLKHTPSSSIVTRGAKLPNFGLWHHHHVTSFHSRRGRPKAAPFGTRKVGRPVGSTKEVMAQLRLKRALEEEREADEYSEPEAERIPEKPPKPKLLESNPLDWSVEDVVQYLQKTEYAPLAPILKDQEIDGQALLMLNLFSVQEYLHLKPEPAEKFCYLIKNLKIEFFTHYVSL